MGTWREEGLKEEEDKEKDCPNPEISKKLPER